jgi:DNA-binding response OmpR family regulator
MEKKKRILIVEDEEDIQDLMKIYIQRSGLDVEIHSAFTGEEGVEIYENMMRGQKKPDLVIMGLKLPGIDGAEATERIRELDKKASIYGFTAFFDTRWSDRLINAGAKGIIPRPIGFNGLVDELKKILGE